MTAYPVAEKFVSINGEGLHAGELAAFIRFKECNLCCKYCDTKWANSADAPAELLTVSELVDFADSSGALNVTLTGGEPLLQTQLPELVTALVRNGFRTEIETNGSLPIGELSNLPERPVFTVDYKLPGSGMENRMLTDNFRFLTKGDSVKFVAGSDRDLIRAREVISEYDHRSGRDRGIHEKPQSQQSQTSAPAP